MSATITSAQLKLLAENTGPDSPWRALLKTTSERKREAKLPPPPSRQRTMRLTLPMPESLTNSGKGRSRHYRTVARAKKAYWQMLDFYVELGRIPDPPSPALGVVRLSSTMYLGNRMDADNAMARHKWPLDWLQRNGFLHNDRLVEWTAVPTQIVKRGQEYRIELELREP